MLWYFWHFWHHFLQLVSFEFQDFFVCVHERKHFLFYVSVFEAVPFFVHVFSLIRNLDKHVLHIFLNRFFLSQETWIGRSFLISHERFSF